MSGQLPPQPWTFTGHDAEEMNDGNGDLIAYVYNDPLAEAIKALPELLAALETSRHALTTLHGLIVADGASPNGSWPVDESKALAEIDAALLVVRGAP